jgi:hypothetical protein
VGQYVACFPTGNFLTWTYGRFIHLVVWQALKLGLLQHLWKKYYQLINPQDPGGDLNVVFHIDDTRRTASKLVPRKRLRDDFGTLIPHMLEASIARVCDSNWNGRSSGIAAKNSGFT